MKPSRMIRSRLMTSTASQFGMEPTQARITNELISSSLSASGSMKAPSVVRAFSQRASNPSSESDKPARMKTTSASV